MSKYVPCKVAEMGNKTWVNRSSKYENDQCNLTAHPDVIGCSFRDKTQLSKTCVPLSKGEQPETGSDTEAKVLALFRGTKCWCLATPVSIPLSNIVSTFTTTQVILSLNNVTQECHPSATLCPRQEGGLVWGLESSAYSKSFFYFRLFYGGHFRKKNSPSARWLDFWSQDKRISAGQTACWFCPTAQGSH